MIQVTAIGQGILLTLHTYKSFGEFKKNIDKKYKIYQSKYFKAGETVRVFDRDRKEMRAWIVKIKTRVLVLNYDLSLKVPKCLRSACEGMWEIKKIVNWNHIKPEKCYPEKAYYQNTCCKCKEEFLGPKYYPICAECITKKKED